MKQSKFDQLISAHKMKGKGAEACRRVLVDGITAYKASKELGVEQSTVSRQLKKLRTRICKSCGQPVK